MECESIDLKGQKAKKILEDAFAGKAIEGYRVSGNTKSPFREVSEQVRGKCGFGMWLPNDAARLRCNEERQLERIQERYRKKR